jgi:hypothetical protein
MAEETPNLSNDMERAKRYLQWATLLVMVAIAVTVIDMMIKNGILRAVKEVDGQLKTVPNGGTNPAPVQSAEPLVDPARASENGSPDASIRISRTPPPVPSEADRPSGHELRVDRGSEDG